MTRTRAVTAIATAALLPLAACDLTPTASSAVDPMLASAFSTAPAGYADLTSSYPAEGGDHVPFLPGRGGPMGMMGGPHRGKGPMSGGPMGGGVGGEFLGAVAADRGGHRGPFRADRGDRAGAGGAENCAFANGEVTCTGTRGGVTISRVSVFKTASGTVQERPDSTTDYHSVRSTAAGTMERREGATATINHSSQRVVTGLSGAQRTVNGTSAGTENASGTRPDGKAFTAVRTAGDTTVNLVIPNQQGRNTYPLSGTVTRRMRAAITTDGETRTSDRREVITYDGSATAKVTVTQDGTTRTCTMPLPRGRLACS